jgi:6-phosphogluconolactonase/glucosamine-6-phosphate isomerase/deaminase
MHAADAAQAAAVAGAALTAAVDTGDIPVLLLLSGGSAFAVLDAVDESVLGPNVTVGMLDERYSPDPAVNNFAQLSALRFFAVARSRGCGWIDTLVVPGETMADLAARFDRSLRQWTETNPAGRIVATMGIGPDGHTAGIMPYPEDDAGFSGRFGDPDVPVVAYDAGDKNPYRFRVTVTLPFLRDVDTAIVFACGENKRGPLQRVLADTGTLSETPARIIRAMAHATVFTDLPE